FVFGFDTALNQSWVTYFSNYFEQFLNAKVYGDTIYAAGHFNVSVNRNLTFDTISHTGSASPSQEGGVFLFDAVSGGLLGLYPSKSPDHAANVNSASVGVSSNYFGIGGAFSQRMTFSGSTNYVEAVDNCSTCNN